MSGNLDAALDHHKAGRLKQAEELYRSILKAEPDNAQALNLLGLLAHQTGNSETGVKLIGKAVAIDDSQPGYHVNLGQALAATGALDKAAASYRRALVIDPGDAAALTNLGVCLQEQGELEESIRTLKAAIERQPDLVPAHVNLGIGLHELGDRDGDAARFEEAISAFGKALEIDPEHAGAHANLGVAYQKQLKFADSIESCLQALKFAPRHAVAQLTLGAGLFYMGRYGEAVEILEIAVGSHPDNPDAYIKLGKAYYRQKRASAAGTAYQYAAKLDPDNLSIHWVLGTFHNLAGEYQPARAAFERVIELDPSIAAAYTALGQALMGLGRADDARQAFAKTLERNPDDILAKYAHGALTDPDLKVDTRDYVTHLFDDFAATFEELLRGKLDYKTPEILAHAVREAAGGAATDWHIADLGCGTGLCGPLFRDMAATLIGADLSEKMIEKARALEVYDDLRVEALEDTLGAAEAEFDLVLAADVFVYIGDLEPVFAACAGALKPGGLFAFSTEDAKEDEIAFNAAMRFAHARPYIERLAAEHGFTIALSKTEAIRSELHEPVFGGIFVLKRD